MITEDNKQKKIGDIKWNEKKKFEIAPYLYLMPALLIFSLFVFFPFIKTMWLSVSLTNIRGEVVEFIGMENFIEIFTSASFVNSVLLTLKFVVLVAVPSIILGLILALLANYRMRGSRVYELMFSLPMAVASAPAAIIWALLFHPTNGIVNYLSGTEVRWLTDPKIALITVAIVTVWLNLGINFIFLLTGLKNIPQDLLESVDIDGGNYIQKVIHIILPLLSPQMFFVIFMNLTSSFQAFAQIRLLTQGGPGDSTNVLVHSIYREAFFNGRFELACAQSIILFAMMLIVTFLQFRFEKKGVHYQ